jgi:hypothetical protein
VKETAAFYKPPMLLNELPPPMTAQFFLEVLQREYSWI